MSAPRPPTPEPGPPEPRTPPFRFGARDHLINLGFWTLFGAVTVAILLSDDYSPVPGHPALEGAAWFVQAYLWAALTPLAFWLVGRFHPGRGAALPRLLVLVGAAVAMVAAAELVREVIWREVLSFSLSHHPAGASFSRFWVHTTSEPVICGSVFAAGFVREHFRRIRAREEHAMRLQAHAAAVEARAAQLQAQLARARLAVLRSQLNPHFLFNTLNAVAGLVEDDPHDALRVIARLSDLLRTALRERDEEEIPLAEELRLTGHYLEILEIRYQGRLRTGVEVDPAARDALVPSLILQPLVENAMKHGVARAGGHGRIEVRARREGERLVLAVHDTGAGEGADGAPGLDAPPPGAGMGLRNARARLRELYGDEQRLALLPLPGGGMVAEVTLPYRPAPAPLPAGARDA